MNGAMLLSYLSEKAVSHGNDNAENWRPFEYLDIGILGSASVLVPASTFEFKDCLLHNIN